MKIQDDILEPLEVKLVKPQNFSIIRETLTRVGKKIRRGRRFNQYVHILHKKGKYYIVHYKDMLALDGIDYEISDYDESFRNRVGLMLEHWGLIQIIDREFFSEAVPFKEVDVLKAGDRNGWNLINFYDVGSKEAA